MNTSDPKSPDRAADEWFGHPPQLARLFTTEMWERFGYYGMRAILSLYLVEYFFFRDDVANGLYGAFTSLVYLTPLVGGLLADRYMGYKRSVKLGAILMAIGYFGLCFGKDLAAPYMEADGVRHAVVIEKHSEGGHAETTKRQFVQINDNRYLVDGQADGSLKLIGESTADTMTIAAGQFRFDGERDPFWVNVMFLSLSCVIVGNGFFKPNISTIVGSLYPLGDSRRDSGFTIFYMGINLGSMISQAACPWLYEHVGPWAGFVLAAGGMAIAWALFQFDGGRLDGYGEPPPNSSTPSAIIYLGACLAVPVMWFLLHNTMQNAEAAAEAAKQGKSLLGYLSSLPLLGKLMFGFFVAAMVGIPLWAFATGDSIAAQKMLVAIVLVVFSVVFWTLFEQAGSSLTYFADRNTERTINLGFTSYVMPAGQAQIFNPLFIVIFAPVFSWLWIALAKRGLEPSIPVKFSIGLILVGLGFMVLVFGVRFANDSFKVGLFWLVLAYLIHSIGELCISPVGLSMITKLSMPKIVGLMMGVWFLSSAMAQYVGGVIAQMASVETVGGEVTNLELALKTYTSVFWTIGLYGSAIGVGLLVCSPLLKRMMHGVR